MRLIAQEIGHFWVAVMFLTRLPVPGDIDHSEGRLARSARYFPLVGILIGLVAGGVVFVASLVLPSIIAAGLAFEGNTVKELLWEKLEEP